MAILSYSTKLVFASLEDKVKLFATLKAEAEAFNLVSQLNFTNSELNIKTFHANSYYKVRDKFPSTPSQIVIKAEQDCLAAYRSIKTNRQELKVPPIKTNLSLQLDKRIFSIKNDKFSLTTTAGRIKVDYVHYKRLDELMASRRLCDPKLFVKNNEIYINLPFEVPTILPEKDLAIGVDLGINRAAATSEGLIFKTEEYNAKKRQLRHLKSDLKSAGTKSSRKHLRRLGRTERNRSKEYCRTIANSILKTTKATVIVLEDLSKIKKNIKDKNKYLKINKLSQAPFYLLRQTIEYKALLLGKRAITVSPFNTSQLDHRTQKKDGVRKGCRYYTKSGQVLDADINAAINLAIRSKLPFLSSNGLDGQAAVIRPIACKSNLG